MAGNSNVVASLLAEINPEILKNFMASHDDYLCPITREIMQDPVIIASGETFERESITQWLSGHNTCPTTNSVLLNKNLIENKSLRRAIISGLETLKKDHPLKHNAKSSSSSSSSSEQIPLEDSYPIVGNLEIRIARDTFRGLRSIGLWDTSNHARVPNCGMFVQEGKMPEMVAALESNDVVKVIKYCRSLGSTANLIADNLQSAFNISLDLPATPITRSYVNPVRVNSGVGFFSTGLFSIANNFQSSASSSEKYNDDSHHRTPHPR